MVKSANKKLTKEQIKDIAEDLDCGMNVYINPHTLEIKSILSDDGLYDRDIWDEEIETIEEEWDDFVVVEKPQSREAFYFMEDFVEEVADEKIQHLLTKSLSKKGPFANFKSMIETYDLEEQWFAFKSRKLEEHVRSCLDINEIPYEK